MIIIEARSRTFEHRIDQRLQWRRDKVRELSVKGHNQRQIASILRVGLESVNEDLQYLRRQAKQNISKYIDEYLAAEHENCLVGLNNILIEAWQLSLDGERRGRLQALSLAKECYSLKLNLLSSATIIERALKFVDRNNGLVPQDNEVMIENDAAELK